MRWLREFETVETAQHWADALLAEGIESTVRQSPDGRYAIWVHEDDRLDAARDLLRELDEGSASRRLEELADAGRQRRRQAARDEASRRPRIVSVRDRFGQGQKSPRVTLGLIAISIAVGVITRLGTDLNTGHYLLINDLSPGAGHVFSGAGFASIERGELWRLVSPVFLHFGILHLVFNLWWLMDLGAAIERIFSHGYLLMYVLVIAVASNLAQYVWTGNALFGGMSGVLYGLFGLLWMRGRLDPGFPLQLSPGTVGMLLVWYVVCLVGLVGPVANTAHTAGLVVGMGWGAVSSGRLRRGRLDR